MKTSLTRNPTSFYRIKQVFMLVSLFCLSIKLSAQDLPSPAANIQTLPLGSYVIPMDNTLQLNSGGYFNLRTYGMIVHLLNNDIKVKWVIRTGKAKDGIDFTVSASQAYPAVGTSASRNFKAGPFVVFAADTAGMAALVNAFYTTNSLTVANRPKIYKTATDVSVDVRYDLSGTKPKAAILNDGGNENIHEDFMIAAAMPATSYAISFGKDLMTGCYTFASEPHNDQSGVIVDTAIIGIKNFVVNGGNFLAQCAAVTNYENSTYGRFQTTTGITASYVNVGSTLNYANPDLSYSQFEGEFEGSNGVVDAWTINAAGTNNHHTHATGTGVNTSVLVASGAKASSTYSGGLVYYLGTHDFRTNRLTEVNGIRMYLNAFLTPSILSCSMSLLPFQLNHFGGSLQSNAAEVKWKVTTNEGIDHFELLKSIDGFNFSTLGSVTAANSSAQTQYAYSDSSCKHASSYYRLKIVREGGAVNYSNTILVKPELRNEDQLTILQNPVSEKLSFQYSSSDNATRQLSIYNSNGIRVHSEMLPARKGNNSYSISLGSKFGNGIYVIELATANQHLISKFIKR